MQAITSIQATAVACQQALYLRMWQKGSGKNHSPVSHFTLSQFLLDPSSQSKLE